MRREHGRTWSLPIVIAAYVAAGHAPCLTTPGALPAIDTLFAELGRDSAHDIKGVLIVRDGCPIAERYSNGDDSATLHDIRSATKSITALLTGIAIDHKLIAGAGVPLSPLLPLPPSGVGAIPSSAYTRYGQRHSEGILLRVLSTLHTRAAH